MVDVFPSILPGEHPADDRPGDGPLTTISTAFESGDCPWCSDYDGDYPKRHAQKAHPDEYAAWKETQRGA